MNKHSKISAALLFTAALLLASAGSALATVHYVDLNSTNSTPPYVNWAMAATNIQDAVDASVSGDEIVVTNGIYASGGRATVSDGTSNRVAVDKPLALRSVNGPQSTIIDGGGSVRCVSLTNGASLSGFTLTNGTAQAGGGANGGTLNNCTLTGNQAFDGYLRKSDGRGGGAYGCTLNDCTLSSNSAAGGERGGFLTIGDGGGAYGCILNNCALSGNKAKKYSSGGAGEVLPGRGGGASGCTLNNCTLSGNSAGLGGGVFGGMVNGCALAGNDAGSGGGAAGGTLHNCILTNNSADENAGGALDCTLNNCKLTGNSAGGFGGGAAGGTLDNCALSGNSAAVSGGGGSDYTEYGNDNGFPYWLLHPVALNNCTLSGNSRRRSGGGTFGGSLNNCIVYFNMADSGPNYDSSSSLNYSCTTPQPTNGVGNISSDPLFVNTNGWVNLLPQSNSPCINAGNNAYAVGRTDLDGNPRIMGDTVDIGAYEFQLPPQLTITFSSNVILAWPTNYAGVFIMADHYEAYFLCSTPDLVSPVVWSFVYLTPVVSNGHLVVTSPIDATQRFYRIAKVTGPLGDAPCLRGGPNPCPCEFECISGVWHQHTTCRICGGP